MIPERGELLITIWAFIPIQPLARPRFNKNSSNIFQPKTNQKALYKELESYPQSRIKEPIIIDTYIQFSKLHKSHSVPIDPKYGDEDNLRKAIMDALQANHIIADDRFVLGGYNFKYLGEEDVAEIRIYKVNQ